MTEPLPNGPNGRAPNGRFTRGWKGGPGNPFAKRAGQLRSAMLRAVSAADVRAIVKAMVKAARDGDVQAAKLVLDRLFGPPVPADLETRIAELRQLLETRKLERDEPAQGS